MKGFNETIWFLCCCYLFLFVGFAFQVSANVEGDSLYALKSNLIDPNNALQNWDPTLANPCTWFYVTCSSKGSVKRLNLEFKNLSGHLASQLGQLSNLQYLKLQNNEISGKIPEDLGNLTNLVRLDLSLNNLIGPIPATLGKLQRLQFLQLGNNSLSGSIPMSLTGLVALQVMDLSNNQLTGEIPVNGSFALFTPMSFINNHFNLPSVFNPFISLPGPDPPNNPRVSQHPPVTPPAPSSGGSVNRTIAVAVAVVVGLLLAAPAISLAYWQIKKQKFYVFDVPAEEGPEVHLGKLKRFSLHEVQVATDNFSDKNILGKGGFGKVYKGLLADGSLVAVKRLKEERTRAGELQFQTEVQMISMAIHPNLLCLLGFCLTPIEWLLIYPFMANGSVASCLREQLKSQPRLNWPIRNRIALGAARGLAYLHDDCDPKIIHRDVKAANILLDEEFEAVVGDFGLAKLMDSNDTHVTTAVKGTIGHIAPEYLSTGKSSEKTDVFGYGVFLLELITGQRSFDLARLACDNDVMLLDWVKGLLENKQLEMLVDSDLQGNYIEHEVEQLIQMALLCTQSSPIGRPKMSEVVHMLEGDVLAERWEELHNNDQLNHTSYSDANWFASSTSHIPPDELSGPR